VQPEIRSDHDAAMYSLNLFCGALLIISTCGRPIEVSVSCRSVSCENKQDWAIDVANGVDRVITNEDAKVLGLSDEEILRNLVKLYKGKKPKSVWLKENEWFKKMSVNMVHVRISKASAEILSIKSMPQVSGRINVRTKGTETGSTTTVIKVERTGTIETGWTKSNSLELSGGISLTIEDFGFSAGVSKTSEWGESYSSAEGTSFSAEERVEVPIEPGKTVKTDYTLYQMAVRARVRYKVSFSGYAVADFGEIFDGHYYWAYPINDLLKADGRYTTQDVEQELEFNYFYGLHITKEAVWNVPPGWNVEADAYWKFGCDFRGNDMSDQQTASNHCGRHCRSTAGCTHFVWTDHSGGTCWMKRGSVAFADAVSDDRPGTVCGMLTGLS